MLSDRTPIIVGVGEASERIDAADYAAASPAALAASAAKAALDDAGAAKLAAHIDVIAAIRQFENSTPGAKAPFGRADNFPRSIARRIGAEPARAVLEVTGGQGPQHLVNEMSHRIADSAVEMVLLVGSEAISTVRHLTSQGASPDWTETLGGELEDRGYGLDGLVTGELVKHGARTPIQIYALFENARRARRGLGREAYRREMGALFAPFTQVAARNPHAMSQQVYDAEALATVTASNRLTADPFPRRVVARDQANQGAAVLLTSVGKARALGIPQDRWIFLQGGADVRERTVIERQDLSASPAAVLALRHALAVAGCDFDGIGVMDLYSCFPIAVFNVCDAFGLASDDPRGLTVTGGLPFFGGAGNNYSMHAIASLVRALRERPDERGLLGANGGFLSKYSVGIYSATPTPWKPFDSVALQAQIDAWPAPKLTERPQGEARVETFTIDYAGAAPRAIVVGRTADEARFVAMSDAPDLVDQLIETDPLGGRFTTRLDERERSVIADWSPAT